MNDRQPNLGCSEITPLMCNSTQDQDFIVLENIKYFTSTADLERVDMETCKQACLNNCSCKAAFFHYFSDVSSGKCYLPSELFTMTSIDQFKIVGNASAFIKVQYIPMSTSQNPTPIPKRENRVAKVVGLTTGSSMFLLTVIVGSIMFTLHRKKNSELEEEYLDRLPEMPTRFSYKELKIATENFSKKLGQGGFGSVFEGTLLKMVRRLHIHHVNLVRLRGYCAWKSQRLLVYDFMCNGSLDRWIYRGDLGRVLEWECKKKIVLDIARGLAYLHEECRQKIIHLDIKPQNILLDSNFTAKVSDFGLSKLVDRNQSQVMTTIKGTPGYIAPEWWSSFITDKVDVYSFGVLLLEILYGRKVFDRSLPEESWHLLFVFQNFWEEGEIKQVDNARRSNEC
ncbi:hypothetical protein QVD17_32192 [Tagetes erecta]|uniref:non-specific serine/threonine protein kinase n=1 Tax=Tagetes erecta TaxID=13708 RepID=A0AAD8NPX0_TARER|nr:hypothetical protein QVD17_32192 [Tagetes erecta]